MKPRIMKRRQLLTSLWACAGIGAGKKTEEQIGPAISKRSTLSEAAKADIDLRVAPVAHPDEGQRPSQTDERQPGAGLIEPRA